MTRTIFRHRFHCGVTVRVGWVSPEDCLSCVQREPSAATDVTKVLWEINNSEAAFYELGSIIFNIIKSKLWRYSCCRKHSTVSVYSHLSEQYIHRAAAGSCHSWIMNDHEARASVFKTTNSCWVRTLWSQEKVQHFSVSVWPLSQEQGGLCIVLFVPQIQVTFLGLCIDQRQMAQNGQPF